MNNYKIKEFVQVATTVFALVLLSMQSMSVAADSRDNDKKNHHERVIRGVAVTGQNDVLGKPLFSWGMPYGPFHFPTMGIYNEHGKEPLTINENTPFSAILATAVDPTFLLVTGATKDDVQPEWVNVPLRDIPVMTDFAFVVKRPLLSVLELANTTSLPPINFTPPAVNATSLPPLDFSPQGLKQAQAEPSNPITLGQWMKASGVAKIVCEGDGATVKLRMRSLIPNRMYAVWATLGLPRDGSSTKFFPIPLGGTPNIFITDKYGDATFKRSIKFCPFNIESTNRPLLTINVQYHANHQNYGAVPEPGFIHGNWLGLITFNHVQFPINVELLDQ